jgi:eukaryotic translation initiation factor 2-alpha kinase 4
VKYHVEGLSLEFSSVKGFTRVAKGPITEVFTVQPDVHGIRSTSQTVKEFAPTLLAIKSAAGTLTSSVKSPNSNADAQKTIKSKIVELEIQLNELRSLRNPKNCLRILDFLVNLSDDSWDLHILTEYANRGSLEDFLQISGTLPSSRISSWTYDLLEALVFLDKHTIVHGRIHTNNVLLSQAQDGTWTIKLSDALFQDSLYKLQDQSNKTRARAVYWTAPELLSQESPKKTAKTDVWDLGIVFLQMTFGLDVPEKYEGPRSILKSNLSDSLTSLITKFFHETPNRRSSADELRQSQVFLPGGADTLFLPSNPMLSKTSSTLQVSRTAERRISRQSITHAASRYALEWEEIRRLGKGGFGEVVLARNKTDKSTFAIKKIRHRTMKALEITVKEVMVLVQLNDPHVVRYFTAWYEPDSTIVTTEGSSSAVGETTEETEPANDENGRPKFQRLNAITSSMAFNTNSYAPGEDFENAIESDSESESEEDDEDDDDDDDEEEDDDDDDDDDDEEEDSGFSFDRKGNGFEVQFSDDPFERKTGAKTATFSDDIFGTNENERSERPSESLSVKRTTSQADQPQCLYIQMEYCPGESLRELLTQNNLDDGKIWDLLRQIVKGLNHIHEHSIIHRDLKPENIFLDAAGTAKIGDFGLSTVGREEHQKTRKDQAFSAQSRDIGTALYIAPEVKSGSKVEYTTKADMFPLGLILAEMCYHTSTVMEHALLFSGLRKSPPEFPSNFGRLDTFRQLITSLVKLNPDERPSCHELLMNDSIPMKITDEAIREALRALKNPKSPYHAEFLNTIFSSNQSSVMQSSIWDAKSQFAKESESSVATIQEQVKERIREVFKSYGAVESENEILFPQSDFYAADRTVVRLLEPSGISVQLPFDFTLGHARTIARALPPATRVYRFGNAYHLQDANGTVPAAIPCANFDIVTTDVLDIALKESEVITVLDDVVHEASQFKKTVVHINHSDLLDEILDFCRVQPRLRTTVKEILTELRIADHACASWAACSKALKKAQVSDTAVTELQRFDFKTKPDSAIEKLRKIFDAEVFDRLSPTLNHMSAVYKFVKKYGSKSEVFISPLSNYDERFYKGGIMFQCLSEAANQSFHILAFGGRYDSLVYQERSRLPGAKYSDAHAVGATILLRTLYAPLEAMLLLQHSRSRKTKKKSASASEKLARTAKFLPRRCAVLVASFDAETLRSVGLNVLATLRQAKISAELARDATAVDDLIRQYANKQEHRWLVLLLKKSDAAWGNVEVRVKSLAHHDVASWQQAGTEVPLESLASFLRSELIDDMPSAPTETPVQPTTSTAASSSQTAAAPSVKVLRAETKTKKINRTAVIEAARSAISNRLAASGAQIVAVELSDNIFEAVAHSTKLSDPESWRKVREMADAAERSYVVQVQNQLEEMRDAAASGGYAGLFHFKSGATALYDLEA